MYNYTFLTENELKIQTVTTISHAESVITGGLTSLKAERRNTHSKISQSGQRGTSGPTTPHYVNL